MNRIINHTFIAKSGLKTFFILITILLFGFSGIYAGAGSTAFEFLLIPVGAREVAMGSGSAVAHNANAYWWNPAGLAYLETKSASLMFNMWFEGISQQRAGFAVPVSKNIVNAFNISMLTVADIEGYSWNDVPTGTFSARDYCFSYSYAKSFGGFLKMGFNFKTVSEQLENEKATALMFDFGGILDFNEKMWVSGVIRNLGIAKKFIDEQESLPLSIVTGAGYRVNKYILLASDITLLDGELKYGFGCETGMWDMLFFRSGWNNNADMGSGLRLGFGIKWKDLSFDYAYAPYGELGSASRLDLNFTFGEISLTESLYRKAKSLFKDRVYRESWIEFNKVQTLSPGYKMVSKWLKKTGYVLNSGKDYKAKIQEEKIRKKEEKEELKNVRKQRKKEMAEEKSRFKKIEFEEKKELKEKKKLEKHMEEEGKKRIKEEKELEKKRIAEEIKRQKKEKKKIKSQESPYKSIEKFDLPL